MFKKMVLFAVAVLTVFSVSAQARRDDSITMLVMPREATPLQIAQDISRRYPIILVCYQMVRKDLRLHAWNGESWALVPVADYTAGAFFATAPGHAIVVENERLDAPSALTPNPVWCATASRISTTNPRALIHLLGLHFDFPFRHWDQFATRYGYEIEEINPTLQNVHWWDLRADQYIEKLANRDFSMDLHKQSELALYSLPDTEPEINRSVSAPVAPIGATDVDITAKAPKAAVKKTPAVIEPAPMIEPTPVPEAISTNPPWAAVEVDPFSTDEVPSAEIVIPAEQKESRWKIF